MKFFALFPSTSTTNSLSVHTLFFCLGAAQSLRVEVAGDLHQGIIPSYDELGELRQVRKMLLTVKQSGSSCGVRVASITKPALVSAARVWAGGLGVTMKSDRIRRWATPHPPSGIIRRRATEASRPSGRRCNRVTTVTGAPKAGLQHELKPTRGTSSKTGLENGAPAALRMGTQNKEEREDGETFGVAVLSFRNDLGAKQQTQNNNRSSLEEC